MSDLEIFSLLIIHSSPSQVCIGFFVLLVLPRSYGGKKDGSFSSDLQHILGIFVRYYSVQVESRVIKAPWANRIFDLMDVLFWYYQILRGTNLLIERKLKKRSLKATNNKSLTEIIKQTAVDKIWRLEKFENVVLNWWSFKFSKLNWNDCMRTAKKNWFFSEAFKANWVECHLDDLHSNISVSISPRIQPLEFSSKKRLHRIVLQIN